MPATPLYSNAKISMKILKEACTPSYFKSLKEISAGWASYLRPCAGELLANGILFFIYPMGVQFADDTKRNVRDYIVSNRKVAEFLEQNRRNIMFFMAPSKKECSIYVKHLFVDQGARNLCREILAKHGLNMKWDGSELNAIIISLPGKTPKKEKSYVTLLIEKLRRDTKDLGPAVKFNLLQHGHRTVSDEDSVAEKMRNISIIQFNIDKKVLERLLRSYGIGRLKVTVKPSEVVEDTFLVKGDKLYVDYSEGISAATYKILTAKK
jgi:hypothetical protein